MTAADLEPAGARYKAGGRGDRRGFLERVLANPATSRSSACTSATSWSILSRA